jgi:SAM-dependent methyltransferase
MTPDQPIAPFDWFANQFTAKRREEFIETIYPHMQAYLKPGDRSVDLGCGAGSITLFLEEQGAHITGIDLAPGLIALAREEAAQRGAKADFIQADVLTYPLGEAVFDLVVCFGNPLTDFPLDTVPSFRERVFQALKPGGHFILEHRDGLQRVAHLREPREVLEQGADSQILRRFIQYDPLDSSYTMEYQHLSSGELYVVKEYVYVAPLVRLLMQARFELLQFTQLPHSFLDIYCRP